MISTHTSRVGCDPFPVNASVLEVTFLLTHPVWDVTNNTGRVRKESQISTHTSRVGCDSLLVARKIL